MKPAAVNSSKSHLHSRTFHCRKRKKTIDELVRDKWLCRTREGNIELGIRSLLDLRCWFRNNDAPSCGLCNEAGVEADLCQNEGCTVRIHKYCLKNLLSQRVHTHSSSTLSPKPPMHLRITEEEAVEAAVNVEEEEENETQATALRSKKRKQRSQRDSTEKVSSQASLVLRA